jgi:transposase
MARRKFEMFQYRQALVRMRQGDSDRQIAAARIMGRRTAANLRKIALERNWLDANAAMPEDEAISGALGQPKRASTTISSLVAQRQRIQDWVAQGVSGVAIYAALQREQGWSGSYSAVRRMLADIRSAEPPQTTCRLDFEPGDAAQVDFGAGPMLEHPDGKKRRTWAFVMTLCFSRHQYVEFVWDQSAATWLGCHRRAFEWFGCVPHRITIDNAKCAITKACSHDPLVQRSYAECAEGYGFRIDPCPPYDPQKKGIVESGVKYVKGNFLALREFRNLADLNEQARAWVTNVAGVRIHGTTRQTPLTLFATERTLMQPLPAIAPDLGTWHQVTLHRDCHVKFDYRLYSAPFALVGKVLWLRATDGAVALYHELSHVATHARAPKPGQRQTIRDHLPPKVQAFFARDRQWLAMQAREVGTSCTQLVDRLLADKILERLRAAQGVIGLSKTYGNARLEAACARALAHDSPFYRTVKSILASGADKSPAAEPITPPAYANPRFARDAASLFASLNPQQDWLH